jgi:hypothetical protein
VNYSVYAFLACKLYPLRPFFWYVVAFFNLFDEQISNEYVGNNMCHLLNFFPSAIWRRPAMLSSFTHCTTSVGNCVNLAAPWQAWSRGGCATVTAQNVNYDMDHTCASSLSSLHLIEFIWFIFLFEIKLKTYLFMYLVTKLIFLS